MIKLSNDCLLRRDCDICNKCKDFVLKNLKAKTESDKPEIEFHDMYLSQFKSEMQKTIVVVMDNKEYRYGKAIREIFNRLTFPYKLFSYLPLSIITFSYIILREIRKKFASKTCRV